MLGIVVPYWNPFADASRLDNLRRCLEGLRGAANVRVLCVEMPAETRSGLADIVLEPGPDSIYIWQKERLINHGCAILADDGIEYLGYVDADCCFASSDFVDRIVARFESGCNLVHGFSRTVGGVPAALASYPKLGRWLHGGSMFLDRDLFSRIGGFYEYCIVGGGDYVLLMAVTGDFGNLEWIFPGEAYREHAGRWLDLFRSVEIRPACAENSVDIFTHGNPHRSRRMRHALLPDFVPDQDIIRGQTLGLSERGKRLLPRLRAYSAHRENRPDVIVRDSEHSSRRL
ncbi:MAG: hypothetical protein WB783_15685 [Arenicellales bacterium]